MSEIAEAVSNGVGAAGTRRQGLLSRLWNGDLSARHASEALSERMRNTPFPRNPEPQMSAEPVRKLDFASFTKIPSTMKVTDGDTCVENEDIVIHGSYQGRLVCRNLIITSGGQFSGDLSAHSVRVIGRLKGMVHCTNYRLEGISEGPVNARTVHVLASASLEGDVTCEEFGAQPGAKVLGRITTKENVEGDILNTPAVDSSIIITRDGVLGDDRDLSGLPQLKKQVPVISGDRLAAEAAVGDGE